MLIRTSTTLDRGARAARDHPVFPRLDRVNYPVDAWQMTITEPFQNLTSA
jgi:hypothetical protein